MCNSINSSVLVGDYVYGFDGGILVCLDVRTGEAQWKVRGYRNGSLIAADGLLILLGEEGTLALIEANPDEFNELSSAKMLEGKNWTMPTLASGKVYLRNAEELVCVNMKG